MLEYLNTTSCFAGSIDLREMTKIMGCLLELEGIGKAKAKEKAVQIFTYLDGNGDGKVDLKEFVFGCMKDTELVKILTCNSVKEQAEKPPELRVISVEDDEVTKDNLQSSKESVDATDMEIDSDLDNVG